jgi:hypothetical protein
VGQGGGQPHLHGDPFGPSCLYSAANYTSASAHPPQVGLSLDGYTIFGRYIDAASSGYSTKLDRCGGHTHDGLTYHYHTQVVSATTSGSAYGVTAGQVYPATTTGPYQCWRGNITADPYFWAVGPSADVPLSPCCSATPAYYALPGITPRFTD